jgi:hypothetical protein
MVFLELGIGMALRDRLPRTDWILRFPGDLVADLLLRGALPFRHFGSPASVLKPTTPSPNILTFLRRAARFAE